MAYTPVAREIPRLGGSGRGLAGYVVRVFFKQESPRRGMGCGQLGEVPYERKVREQMVRIKRVLLSVLVVISFVACEVDDYGSRNGDGIDLDSSDEEERITETFEELQNDEDEVVEHEVHNTSRVGLETGISGLLVPDSVPNLPKGWEKTPQDTRKADGPIPLPRADLDEDELAQLAANDETWRAADGSRYQALFVREDGTTYGRRGSSPKHPAPGGRRGVGGYDPGDGDPPEAAILQRIGLAPSTSRDDLHLNTAPPDAVPIILGGTISSEATAALDIHRRLFLIIFRCERSAL